MMKLWLCEGPAVGRIEKEVLKRRKKHIRENIVVKVSTQRLWGGQEHRVVLCFHLIMYGLPVFALQKIIAKETIKSEKERTNLNHLSMGKGGVGVACDDDDDTNTTGEDLSHATGSDVEFVESDKDYDDYDDDCDGCPECQICLDAFEVGDRICWSHNPDCRHVFHIECLEPWLLKHEECPMCRERYILPRKTLVNNDDVESQHKAAEFFGPSHGFVITSDDTIHGDQEDEREAEKARPKDMETNQLEMTATMEV